MRHGRLRRRRSGLSTPRRLRLVVAAGEDGRLVSELLTGRGGLPPPVAKDLLQSRRVRVNGRFLSEDARLAPRDEVFVHVLARAESAPAFDESRILLSDPHVLVIDKPPGIPSQGTEEDPQAGVDALLQRWLVSKGEKKPFLGLVHRLDTDTSGVLLFARSQEALRSLNEQFRQGTVRKRYTLLVTGGPDWETQAADGPIGPDRVKRGVFAVSPQGRPALTRFRMVEKLSGAARLEALPETGRTHQIRVHAAALGHPLLGDSRYGGPAQLTRADGHRIDLTRVALHASQLQFEHPDGSRRTVDAPWPADLSAWEQDLKNASKVP